MVMENPYLIKAVSPAEEQTPAAKAPTTPSINRLQPLTMVIFLRNPSKHSNYSKINRFLVGICHCRPSK